MDEIDQKILRILANNGRISFTKIAKKLGIATNTVITRYKRLKKGAILYSAISLDLNKLGYIGLGVFLIKVENKTALPKVIDDLFQVRNVIVAIKTIGAIDAWAIAPFSNYKELFKLKQNISKIPNVGEIEILIGDTFSRWPLSIFASLLQNFPRKT